LRPAIEIEGESHHDARPDLTRRLTQALADGKSGVGFVYEALEAVASQGSSGDALLVVEVPGLGRQVFRAGRRSPWGGPLGADARLQPGLYVPGASLPPDEAASIANLCVIALRLDLLRHDASRDSLTGLLNRRAFDQILDQSVARSSRYGWPFALAIIDVDRFKALNDRVGHAGGDRLLRTVGVELQTTLRSGDVAARVGGDEFALILAKGGPATLEAVVHRLDNAVHAVLGDAATTFSAGYALAPEEAARTEELYKLADERLYQVKAR
jgi:diguanylate cyclase (GGDEF)-like protein